MRFLDTTLDGVILIEPQLHGDHRGWFMETYNVRRFNGLDIAFVQDNHSYSAAKGTLRGLHYQKKPMSQSKLVRCTRGAIFDVAVDLRIGSSTYKKWYGVELTAENKKQLFIPKGYAHGFMTLVDHTEVQYKVDEIYSRKDEGSLRWDDAEIAIEWPLDIAPILSEKDSEAPTLKHASINFIYGD